MPIQPIPSNLAHVLPTVMTRTSAETKPEISESQICDSFVKRETKIASEDIMNFNVPAAAALVAGDTFVKNFTDVINAPAHFMASVFEEPVPENIRSVIQIGAQIICSPITLPFGLIYGAGNSAAVVVNMIRLASED